MFNLGLFYVQKKFLKKSLGTVGARLEKSDDRKNWRLSFDLFLSQNDEIEVFDSVSSVTEKLETGLHRIIRWERDCILIWTFKWGTRIKIIHDRQF